PIGDAMTETFDPTALSPEEFARLVATSSDEQLRELLDGPQRASALDEIFGRMEEHFNADAARGVDAVIHFRLTGGDGDGDTYEVVIRDATCATSRGAEADNPRVVLELDAVDFLRLITGNASGPSLFMA